MHSNAFKLGVCVVPADVADANGQPAGAAPLGSPSSAPSDVSELVDPLQEAAGVQLSRRNSFEVGRTGHVISHAAGGMRQLLGIWLASAVNESWGWACTCYVM
jgi:hypothetical protein